MMGHKGWQEVQPASRRDAWAAVPPADDCAAAAAAAVAAAAVVHLTVAQLTAVGPAVDAAVAWCRCTGRKLLPAPAEPLVVPALPADHRMVETALIADHQPAGLATAS
jgi:hypothetical protein